MSYCRFARDSDLYVFASDRGFECCWCGLDPDANTVVLLTAAEMVDHVRSHIAAGHDVPGHVIPRLLDDESA